MGLASTMETFDPKTCDKKKKKNLSLPRTNFTSHYSPKCTKAFHHQPHICVLAAYYQHMYRMRRWRWVQYKPRPVDWKYNGDVWIAEDSGFSWASFCLAWKYAEPLRCMNRPETASRNEKWLSHCNSCLRYLVLCVALYEEIVSIEMTRFPLFRSPRAYRSSTWR